MLLERLKSETASQHTQLESILAIPASVEEYRLRLAGFLGFVEPWEERVVRRLAEFPNIWETRLKTTALIADLQALGMSAADIAEVPRCARLPEMASVPAAMGSFYVMEGSTLGGQMIARELQGRLNLSPECLHYFSSYGGDVGRRWQEFRQLLLGFSSQKDDEMIITAAGDTFARLGDWFSFLRIHGAF